MVDLQRQFVMLTARTMEDLKIVRAPLPSDGSIFQMFIIASGPVFEYIQDIDGTFEQLEAVPERLRITLIISAMKKYAMADYSVTFEDLIKAHVGQDNVDSTYQPQSSKSSIDVESCSNATPIPDVELRSDDADKAEPSQIGESCIFTTYNEDIACDQSANDQSRILAKRLRNRRNKFRYIQRRLKRTAHLNVQLIRDACNSEIQEELVISHVSKLKWCVYDVDKCAKPVNVVVSSQTNQLIADMEIFQAVRRYYKYYDDARKLIAREVLVEEWNRIEYREFYHEVVVTRDAQRKFYFPSHYYNGKYYILEQIPYTEWIKVSYMPALDNVNIWFNPIYFERYSDELIPSPLLTQAYRSVVRVRKKNQSWCRWMTLFSRA